MKKLRSGYTTGACAAAAAKAAVLLLGGQSAPQVVEIPFPDAGRHQFKVIKCSWSSENEKLAGAEIVKDAGDDPDVTNGASIIAYARFAPTPTFKEENPDKIIILGGKGVGKVTKPGLAVGVGQPAINPVPEQMIRQAVREAREETQLDQDECIEITITIPQGEELAKKTLNYRLGIIGGLSILGTTGIVRPVSAAAWTATISTSMSVAKEVGLNDIVLSTGRTSELAVMNDLGLPEEAYVMMGDYLQFSLQEAKKYQFSRIHLCGMWAKILKGAMRIPQTHVRNGALEISAAIDFLGSIGVEEFILTDLKDANTAREIYLRLVADNKEKIIAKVCKEAQSYAQEVSGLPVALYLVHSSKKVVHHIPAD